MSCSTTNQDQHFQDADSNNPVLLNPDPQTLKRSDLKVPRTDGSIFSIPEFREADALIESNKILFKEYDSCITLKSFRALRESARKEVLDAALGYTTKINPNQKTVPLPETFIITGHQPALYHSGVWIKNFAAGLLAKKSQGVAINLIVDNDLMTSGAIRVPSVENDSVRVEQVPLDSPHPVQPWEEVKIQDPTIFADFQNRVESKIQSWNSDSVLSSMWPYAVEMSGKSKSLRDCLTAARHHVERTWGNEILEIPISQLCLLPSFSIFLVHILKHLDRFHEIYNSALLDFRKLYKIRSQTHPVPDLKTDGDKLEAPFWIWRKGENERHRLMVQNDHGNLTLSFDGTELFKVDVRSENLNEVLNYELKQLNANGFRIRTRALTTTLFSRLFLGDLFIHGIGGAKYDEMTDEIIHQFYGLEPPRFLTLSATAHLPLREPSKVNQSDLERIHRLKRDLQYNPERYLDSQDDPEIAELIARKQELIAEQKSSLTNGLSRSQRRKRSRKNRMRFYEFAEIRNKLHARTEELTSQLKNEEEVLRNLIRENEKTNDREYSFCLFPVEKIRTLMKSLES